jgi:hypothetical protein
MQLTVKGKYFMSEQDQDAVIGRIVRELKAENIKLAALQVEAQRIGSGLSQIGTILSSQPHLLFPQGAHIPAEFIGTSKPSILGPDYVDFPMIVRLTNEIRDCMMEIKKLDAQSRALGI